MARKKNNHVRKPKYGKRNVKHANKKYGPTPIDIIKTNLDLESTEVNRDIDISNDEFFCVECDRPFIDINSLSAHQKTKSHKKRIKELKEVPYSIKESEKMAGLL
ncbi:hypothetical protein EDEG_00229 [Edhazardia aedis USNM 41457]|uniref:C2H2-type domain-containing protein n=1 Tax=Edhazardia aedis (strain USNM 41457) TaxID=1003232 RepID=J9D6V1_EDHAE|nr:hypothetical protein EDEG_00229 [Edhazardia aedis USNM 41457]|eukprot:EJW03249.1 hypothetical protein EDEG_00229 [Edhazardia aedis USNM 41457]